MIITLPVMKKIALWVHWQPQEAALSEDPGRLQFDGLRMREQGLPGSLLMRFVRETWQNKYKGQYFRLTAIQLDVSEIGPEIFKVNKVELYDELVYHNSSGLQALQRRSVPLFLFYRDKIRAKPGFYITTH